MAAPPGDAQNHCRPSCRPTRAARADATGHSGTADAGVRPEGPNNKTTGRHGDGLFKNLTGAVSGAGPPGWRQCRSPGRRPVGGAAVLCDFGLPDFLCADRDGQLPGRNRQVLRQPLPAAVSHLSGGSGVDVDGACDERRRLFPHLRRSALFRGTVPGAS
ncbi:hypothetical protein G6F65_019926 [Rhizopus arrhizus]|nr:hypothetical protein G6F65_019926 [Rhizopus arrhizus]